MRTLIRLRLRNNPDGVPGPHFTKTFSPVTANNPIEHFMDIQQLYVTFTNKKVVTSMLILGIGLGLVLSAMTRYLAGKWYMPTAFVGVCLFVAIVYTVLARQAGLVGLSNTIG